MPRHAAWPDGARPMRVAAWKGPFPGPASRPGRNKVIASYADGFILHTDDGDNKLDGVDHGAEDLQQNESAANLLRLEANDGDNSVINIKAVQ